MRSRRGKCWWRRRLAKLREVPTKKVRSIFSSRSDVTEDVLRPTHITLSEAASSAIDALSALQRRVSTIAAAFTASVRQAALTETRLALGHTTRRLVGSRDWRRARVVARSPFGREHNGAQDTHVEGAGD